MAIAHGLHRHLAAELTSSTEQPRKARLHYELGHLREFILVDLEEASSHYRKAHGLDSTFEPTIAGLIRVLSLLGQWDSTLSLYDEQVALSANAEDKAGLLFSKAVILEMRLGKLREARAAYVQALKLAPNEAALLRAVARLARVEKDYPALDQALALQAQATQTDANFAAAHAAERARMIEVQKKNPGQAIEVYQQSFDLDPMASPALIALERLYSSSGQPREHAAILGRRAGLVSNQAAKASALFTAGSLIFESLGDAKDAARYIEAAWKAQPDNLALLRELEELYRHTGDYEAAVGALERLEQRTKDPDDRAGLCVRIAELLHRRLDRRDDAVKFWERARQLSPALSGGVEPLIAYYEEAGAWPQLMEVLRQEEAASQDTERRAMIHLRLAGLTEKLSDRDAAIEHFRAALGLSPTNDTASRGLSRLLEDAGRYEELVEIHQRAADTTRDQEVALVHLFKVGLVLEDLLKSPERAVVVYQSILQKSPAHMGALLSLGRAAERAKEYGILVDALIEEAAATKTSERKVSLLSRAGHLCEKYLSQEQRAIKLYTEALTLDKGHAPTLDSFAKLHERAGRVPELLKVLSLRLFSEKEPKARAELEFRMGRLCEEHLRQDETALAHFRKAHEAQPGFGEVLVAMERCLLRLGRHEELAEVFASQLESQEQGLARAETALALGRVYELRLGRLDKAQAAYEQALNDVPDYELALDARMRVLERQGDPIATAQAHGERARASADPAVRLWARLRQAEILDGEGHKPSDAIAAYEAVLDEHPHHPGALGALERLYEAKSDLEQVRRVVGLQAASMQDAGNQLGAYRELLRLAETSLDSDEPPSAAPHPGHLGPLPTALIERRPGDRPALRFAEILALKHRNPEELAPVDVCFSRLTSQATLASAHHLRLGELLEGRNSQRALAQYRPALALDPQNIGAARGLSRLAAVIGDADLLAEAAELEAHVARDPKRAAELLTQSARALSRRGEDEGAIERLKRALVLYPDSLPAGRDLYRLLLVRDRFSELTAILSTAAQASSTIESQVAHWIAVAKVLADYSGDLPAAVAALERVERSGAKSLACHLELADLLLRDRQWRPAVEQLTKAVALRPADHVVVALRLRLAEIYHEHMHKVSEATRELVAVVELSPHNIEGLHRLLSIQMQAGAAGAMKTAQALSEAATGRQRAKAHLAIGRLFVTAKKPKDAKKPFAAAVTVLGLDPPDAAEGLRAILLKEAAAPEAWALYTRALAAYVADTQPGEQQSLAYLELGRSLIDRQRAVDEGIAALSSGFSKNPASDELQLELALRLKAAGRHADALPQIAALIQTAPHDLSRWSSLVEVYSALGKNAEVNLATGALVHLGGGSELQRSTWASRRAQAAMLPEGAFDAEALAHTSSDRQGEDALALLAHLTGPLSKVYPPELSTIGLSSRAKISARGNHPCRPALDRVCHCFGGLEIDLYPTESEGPIRVILTDPIGLVIPPSVLEMTDVEQVFVMARYVANVARHAAVVDALTESKLRVTLAAAARIVELSVDDPKLDPSELASTTRRLAKALPWLAKGRIEDAARRYGASPLVDVVSFRRQVQLAGFRAALILCDDVAPLFRLQKGLAAVLGLQANEADALVSQLLPYWASADFIALRQRLGLP